ncbi:YfiT family bacillithiol transferase [Paenibacillus sp. strain BS8-2]
MDLRYPIGTFTFEGEINSAQREKWIQEISDLPALIREATNRLSEEQLQTPYRDGGWTVRQVVHHIADSHMNSLMRFKLALTEQHPTIRPYDETSWAELADSVEEPIETSLDFITSLHRKWVTLLRSMNNEQFARTFYHPGRGESNALDRSVGMYAWHGNHHLAHITSLTSRMGWKE